MRSPITYFGGKSRLANRIVEMFPDHNEYVEVFGGGASVLFAKQPCSLEIYNDLDGTLVNFFRVLADPKLFRAFHRRVVLLPSSRVLQSHCMRDYAHQADPVEAAALWFAGHQQSFSYHTKNDSGWKVHKRGYSDRLNETVATWLSRLDRLNEAHARLHTVTIEQLDFRRLIDLYDRPGAVLYLDPPYVTSTRCAGVYKCELIDADHKDLVARLRRAKGWVVLSGYDSDLYRPLDRAGWVRTEIASRASMHRHGHPTQTARTEVLWSNYTLID